MIFIPTYNPDIKLKKNLDKLTRVIPEHIITIINDGSKSTNSKIILREIAKRFKNINLVNLKKNSGKGSAIKQALKLCKKNNYKYALFIDDDGQHSVSDVHKFYIKYKQNKKLVIGKRNINYSELPLASFIGNKISSIVVYLVTGKFFIDTQCGLRLIPQKFFDFGLGIKSNQYDYEFEFITKYSINHTPLIVPIKTIYFNKNVKSKFKKFKDSYLVLNTIISKNYLNNFSLCLDYIIFFLLQLSSLNFFTSSIFSKFLSNIFNFYKLKDKKILIAKKYMIIIINFLVSIALVNLVTYNNISLNLFIYLLLNIYFSIFAYRVLNSK